ncbi:NERD domain-containing protein, partial [Dolichospermum sp. ST_sed3]|nr:NERD domain-containing protein [Dolichospermum sp. ST_sed3]
RLYTEILAVSIRVLGSGLFSHQHQKDSIQCGFLSIDYRCLHFFVSVKFFLASSCLNLPIPEYAVVKARKGRLAMPQASKRLEEIGGKDIFRIFESKGDGPVCYPPFPIPSGKGGDMAERNVFATLRKALGADWIMFHSFAVLERQKPDQNWQSDIDFVLLHRSKGVFVLEVKDIPLSPEQDKLVARYSPSVPIDVLSKIRAPCIFSRAIFVLRISSFPWLIIELR